MEHRRCVEKHIVGPRAERDRALLAVGEHVAVAQGHALGAPRGAAGIEQHGGVVLARLMRVGGHRVGEQRLVLRRDRQGPLAPRGELVGVGELGQRLVDDQQPAIRIVEDVADLGAREPDIDRHRHPARPVPGMHQLGVAEGVAREDRVALARADAEPVEHARRAARPVDEFAPGEHALVVDHRGPRRIEPPRPIHRGDHGQHRRLPPAPGGFPGRRILVEYHAAPKRERRRLSRGIAFTQAISRFMLERIGEAWSAETARLSCCQTAVDKTCAEEQNKNILTAKHWTA